MDPVIDSPVRVRLLGANVDMVTSQDVLGFTQLCIDTSRKAIVANHNAHSLALLRRDRIMRVLYAMADIVEIDSMPLIAWGRLLGEPLDGRHRCTYLDWREDFWRLAQINGWRVFYLGGKPGVAAAAADNIEQRWPGVTIGVHHGYFDHDEQSLENREVLETINAFAPDVLMVGLGMPIQERWVTFNYDRIERGVVFTVGGAFDYEAGVQATPPRWIAQLGFEWLYRLATQPGRLFGRYCIEPWRLAPMALEDVFSRIGSKESQTRSRQRGRTSGAPRGQQLKTT